MKVSILGAGKAGKTIGFLLRKAGYKIEAVVTQNIKHSKQAVKFIRAGLPSTSIDTCNNSDLIILAAPDDKIETMLNSLKTNAIVLNISGVHSTKTSFHPLMSFADPKLAAKNFRGTFCFLESPASYEKKISKLIKDIGGIPVKIKGDKAMYHAACVFSSNYLVALLYTSVQMLKKIGVSEKTAFKSILKLSYRTLENVDSLGVVNALTGPIERGDSITIKKHIQSLKRRTPKFLNLYKELARITCEIARLKGSKKLGNIKLLL